MLREEGGGGVEEGSRRTCVEIGVWCLVVHSQGTVANIVVHSLTFYSDYGCRAT